MKNNQMYCRQIRRIVRLVVLFTIGFIFQVTASISPWSIKINTGKQTIKVIFEQVEKQTGKITLFSNNELKIDKVIDINVENQTLEELYSTILQDSNLEYEITEKYIVIRYPLDNNKSKQQDKFVIKGRVCDVKKHPIPGVTIRLSGTSLGTVTNYEGVFQLTLPIDKGELMFSFVGFKTKLVSFTSVLTGEMNIILEEEILALDETVVVAYGTSNKREMTGAVTVIKSDDIKDIPSPNISNLLQGRVAGMDVTNLTGAPGGGGTNVTIRGFNSLSVESGRRFSNPLWVVDGVPMNTFTSPVTGTNSLSDINPEMIESIQVLKDASAASLYGSRAANGVIIVTTKKGHKNQEAQFDINFSYSYNVLSKYPEQTRGRVERAFRLQQIKNERVAYYDEYKKMYTYPTSYEETWNMYGPSYDGFWIDGYVENGNNGSYLQDSLNPFFNNSTNFFKYYFDAAKTLNANIQTSGGGEKNTYSVGLGYYKEDGILKGTGYKRLNLMGNFIFDPRPWLTVDLRTYLAYTDRSRGKKSNSFSSGNEIEVIPGDPYKQSSLFPGNSTVTEEALKKLQGIEEKNNSYRLRVSFGLRGKIIKGLEWSNTISLDFSQNNRNYFAPSWMNTKDESESMGEINRSYSILDELLVTYKHIFKELHKLDVMFGYSYQYDQDNYNAGSAKNGPSDYVHYVGKDGWPDIETTNGRTIAMKNYRSDFSEKKMESYFGRINYSYSGKYLASVTLRRDGSSVFGKDLRWATFPSIAIGWNFSEENFLDDFEALSFGKIRTSYGISGNQFNSPYLAYGILEGGENSYDGQPIIQPNFREGYWNKKLGWEETRQFDFGLELNFFDYRLGFIIDYYYRYTKDMLSLVPLPGKHYGYLNAWMNAGALSNEGIEFEISYNIFRRSNFNWHISLNMAKNWNMLRKTYDGRDINATSTDYRDLDYVLGKPIGSIFGNRTNGIIQSGKDIHYLYRPDGSLRALEVKGSPETFFREGDVNFTDINGDGYIDEFDYVYLGSSLPKLYGGIVNEINIKNWDLNILFSYSLGRDMINGAPQSSISKKNNPIFVDLRNVTFWEKEGDKSDFPYLQPNNYNGTWTNMKDYMVEHVNYLKLKTLTVGYTFPKEWLKKCFIRDVRFFFSGENLLTWTNYSGLDPETVDINTGYDKGDTYPLARKLIVGVTIKL